MESWFIFSILALITWGFWGFFPKIALMSIDPRSAAFYEVIGGLIFGIMLLFLINFKLQTNINGITFAMLTGFAALLGGLFFLMALSTQAKLSHVVIITALYPVITIILSFVILNESVTLKQGIAMILALIAIILFYK